MPKPLHCIHDRRKTENCRYAGVQVLPIAIRKHPFSHLYSPGDLHFCDSPIYIGLRAVALFRLFQFEKMRI